MKAILVNEEIKTFGSVPKKWSDENGLHLNIGDGSAFGFKDVVTPTYDGRIEELANLHLDGDVYTYDVIDKKFSLPLDTYKERKISELKTKAYNDLLKTDWAIVRKAETDDEIPLHISEERAIIRNTTNEKEAEINALTTKKDVVSYKI